ncbi:hypothetical protein MAPG_05542 [Magnaporthiopsis poae ATCC 64411]|uniref:Uncharacterized protein n=1 Tax=Magnaporthiopsis poae (strain ATCC 64411 / 73-15) TaxID=644358 RepID=A0A0C4DZN6_MAGP6|nr:hypothetical protein MAPG_05542 [Magnaporthiopsis poae ATCC 64411]
MLVTGHCSMRYSIQGSEFHQAGTRTEPQQRQLPSIGGYSRVADHGTHATQFRDVSANLAQIKNASQRSNAGTDSAKGRPVGRVTATTDCCTGTQRRDAIQCRGRAVSRYVAPARGLLSVLALSRQESPDNLHAGWLAAPPAPAGCQSGGRGPASPGCDGPAASTDRDLELLEQTPNMGGQEKLCSVLFCSVLLCYAPPNIGEVLLILMA